MTQKEYTKREIHYELVNSPRSKLIEFKTRTDSQLSITARFYSFRATAWMADCGLMGRNPSSPQPAGIRRECHLIRTLCLCFMSSLRSSVTSFLSPIHFAISFSYSPVISLQNLSSFLSERISAYLSFAAIL